MSDARAHGTAELPAPRRLRHYALHSQAMSTASRLAGMLRISFPESPAMPGLRFPPTSTSSAARAGGADPVSGPRPPAPPWLRRRPDSASSPRWRDVEELHRSRKCMNWSVVSSRRRGVSTQGGVNMVWLSVGKLLLDLVHSHERLRENGEEKENAGAGSCGAAWPRVSK